MILLTFWCRNESPGFRRFESVMEARKYLLHYAPALYPWQPGYLTSKDGNYQVEVQGCDAQELVTSPGVQYQQRRR